MLDLGRTANRRIEVRLTDEQYDRIVEHIQAFGYENMKDFILKSTTSRRELDRRKVARELKKQK